MVALIRDSRFRTVVVVTLILVLAMLGYKFVGGGIGSKQTNLHGPRYFNGHVSESEIYAGAINLAGPDRGPPIVYLQETTMKSKGKRSQKRLPAAVERLAHKPFRQIYSYYNGAVAPTKVPIRRVANYVGLIDKNTNVINGGLYIEVGPIRKSWFNRVRISVHSFTSGQGHELVDYVIIMDKGRLVFKGTLKAIS